MRRQVVEALAVEHFLPMLPGFTVTRGIIHRSPISGLLRGFSFQSSAFDAYSAYVWVFVQPLYVREDTLVFNIGKRIGYGMGRLTLHERWDLKPETLERTLPTLLEIMIRDGLSFIRKRDTIELFIRNLQYGIRFENTLFDRESFAYSLAWLGRYGEAARRLESLIRSIKPGDLRQDVRENAEQLLRAIQTGTDHAQDLLRSWAEETSRNLHLPIEA